MAVDDEDRPLAFGDLEHDGHIGYLYCAPEAAGKGVAAALYDRLERAARERGLKRLHAEASEAARRFFLRKGFSVVHRRAFEISGVHIHNYAVEKGSEARWVPGMREALAGLRTTLPPATPSRRSKGSGQSPSSARRSSINRKSW